MILCVFCRIGVCSEQVCPGFPDCECPHNHIADSEDIGDVSTHLLDASGVRRAL